MAVDPELKTARFNVRQAVKELLLLEKHLTDPAQRCPDCIAKHVLTFEALVDEAKALDGARDWRKTLEQLTRLYRSINVALRTTRDPSKVAPLVRNVRKAIQMQVLYS